MKKLFLYLTILILSAIVQNNKLLAAEQAGPEQAAAKAAGVPAKAGAASQAAAGGPMVVGAVPGGAGPGGAAGISAGEGPGGAAAKTIGGIKVEYLPELTPEEATEYFRRDLSRDPGLFLPDITKQKIQWIKFLLEKGANVNAHYPTSDPPLIVAERSGRERNIELTKLLLDYGANVNVQDSYGLTALIYAALNNDPKMIYFLLENGADLKTLKTETDWNHQEFLKIINQPGMEAAKRAYEEYKAKVRKGKVKAHVGAIKENGSPLSIFPPGVADIIAEYAVEETE